MTLGPKQNKKNKKPSKKSDTSAEKQGLFSLEPRIVFDAAAPVALSEFAESSAPDSGEATSQSNPVADIVAALEESELVEASSDRSEIVFIDSSAQNAEAHVTNINQNAEVVFLDPQTDGVLQIAEVLSQRGEFDAIHIIAGGSESKLALGTAEFAPAELSTSHQTALESISGSLKNAANILIYGSEFGSGESGATALAKLGEFTGAGIAAGTIADGGEPESDAPVIVADVLATPSEYAGSTIVFVDQNLENIDQLISLIDPSYEVVMINGSSDGVEQIAFALDERTDLAAIHILSHGEEGRLFLGDTVLDSDSMRGEHADELSVIGAALSDDGDILIYGCDFTGGSEGLEAAILLGSMTRADIAASKDGTGHIGRGGDWELEDHVGDVDADGLAATEWDGLLAPEATLVEVGGPAVLEPETTLIEAGIPAILEPETPIAEPSDPDVPLQEALPAVNITVVEDTPYMLTGADFDTDNDWAEIEVLSLSVPAGASLTIEGVDVSVNDKITRAQIDAGKLVFTPAENDSGSNYATIGFDAVPLYPTNSAILGGDISKHTVGGDFFSRTDNRITDPELFGPEGTIPTSISLVDSTSWIDAEYLSKGDILFDGFVRERFYSIDEFNDIDAWVKDGGVLITTNDAVGFDGLSTYFGLPIQGDSLPTWTVADDTSRIINGPFGSVGPIGTPIETDGARGYFDPAGLLPGDQVLAYSGGNTDQPTMVMRQHGDGWILFTGDEGIFEADMSDGTDMMSPNEILVGNIFAWAVNPNIIANDASFDVTPVNDLPIAEDDTVEVIEDGTTTFNPLSNDSDVESDVYLTDFEQPDFGALELEIGEAHSIEVDAEGLTVELKGTYTNPVVFVFTTTENEGHDEPDIARVTDVTGNSFHLAIVEPNSGSPTDTTDGKHGKETVSFMVLEAGTWTLADGTVLEVGTREIGTNGTDYTAVEFDHKFDARPTVLSQIQTDNTGVKYNETRQAGGDKTSFKVTNEPSEYQSNLDFSETPEVIGYLAIERGTGTWSGMAFEAGLTGTNITHEPQLIKFEKELGEEVNFIGQVASANFGDEVHLDGRELDGKGIAISLQEDTTASSEVAHNDERAGWLAWGGSGILSAASGQNFSIASKDVSFSYTSDQDDVNGVSRSFTYKVVDADGAEDKATVTLDIVPEADTVADDVETSEDTPVTFNVLSNDNFEGAVKLTDITGATNGTVSFDSAGKVTYTPNADFSGTETLTYTVTEDDVGTTETGTVEITVVAAADAPLIGYAFDGTDIVYAMDANNAFPTDKISVDVEFQRDNTTGSVSLLSYAVPGSNNEMLVWLSSSAVSLYINGKGYSMPTPADTDLHRASFTYDASAGKLKIYLDGELGITHNVTSGALAAGGSLTFGQEQDNVLSNFDDGQAFKGTLYSADIYNGILTDQQIADRSAGNGDTVSIDFSQMNNFEVHGDSSAAIPVFTRGEVTGPSTIVDFDATLEDNNTITLDLRSHLTNLDGSETLKTEVSNIPVGVVLSDGGGNTFTAAAGSTSVDVSAWTLENIILTPVENSDEDIKLEIRATAIETSNGDQASTTSDVIFVIKAVADKPDLATANEAAYQGTVIDLSDNITGGLVDTDGSEKLSYKISNIPTGSTIQTSDGAGGVVTLVPVAGVVSITETQRETLKFLPPSGYSGTITLDVVAISTEGATGDQVETAAAESNAEQIVLTITNPPPVVVTPIADQSGADATTASLNVSTAFNDPDGDTLAYSATGLPTGLSINTTTGLISGTIDNSASQSGPYTVVVTADDGEGGTVTDTFAWTVTNPGPVATADSVTTAEDTLVSGDVSTNDSDTDGDDLTYTKTSDPSNGSVSFNANGTFSYTPAANFNGTDSFTYKVSDGEGGTDTATVSITITAVNDAPVIELFPNQYGVDGQAIIPAQVQATDIEGDTLTYSAEQLPPGLSIDSSTGIISGTLDNSASVGSPYGVKLIVSDGTSTEEMLVGWWVSNPAPEGLDESFTTNEDTAVSGNVLTNDTDPDGDTLVVGTTPIATPEHGTVTLAADGTFTYTPDANYSGDDKFAYKISDGEGGTTTAVTYITIDPVLDAPLIGYEFDGSDIIYAEDGANEFPTDQITIDVVYQRENATDSRALIGYAVPGSNNELVIWPTRTYVGVFINGSQYKFSFDADTEVHRFTVTYDSTSTTKNLNAYMDGVFLGTRNVSSGALDAGGALIFGQEQDAVLTNFDSGQSFKGTLYSANIYSNALTDQQVTDNSAGNGDAVSIDFSRINNFEVVGDPASTFSVFTRGEVTDATTIKTFDATLEDTNTITMDLRSQLVDTDGSEALETVVSNIPVGASITDGAGNSFTATAGDTKVDVSSWALESVILKPVENSDADITLTINATSKEGATSDTASVTSDVTFIIKAVADKPSLATSNETVAQDTVIDLSDNLTGTLVDTDGSESLSYQISNLPTGSIVQVGDGAGGVVTLVPIAGAVTLSETQRATLQFLPPDGFLGTITLDVKAVATEGATGNQVDTATADSDVEQILLRIVNTPPTVSTPIADRSDADAAVISLDASSAFTDADGHTLTYSVTGLPTGLSINTSSGEISGTIDNSASQSGPYTVVVTADDGKGGTVTDTFIWTVTNPAPTAVADSYTINEDTVLTGNVLSNDTDPDGDNLSGYVGLVTGPTNGAVSLANDGSFTYTPNPDFNGTDSFTYKISDGEGGTDEGTVSITVDALADAPLIGYEYTGGEILYASDTAEVFPTEKITIDLVFQRDNTTTDMGMFSYAVPGQANEVLIFQNGSLVDVWIGGSNHVFTLPATTDVQHLTVTFDGTAATDNVNLYSNGVHVGGAQAAATSVTAGGSIALGHEQDGYLSAFEEHQEFIGTFFSANVYDGIIDIADINDGSAGSGDVVALDFSKMNNTTVKGDTSSSIVEFTRGSVIYPDTIVPYEPTVEDLNTIILDLRTTMQSAYSTETVSTVVSAIPVGVSISDGAGNTFTATTGTTSVDVSTWEMENIVLTPVADDDSDITLIIISTAEEPSNGDTASAESYVTFMIKADADTPTLTTSDETSTQNSVIDLSDNIAGALSDTDGSETLSYKISNIMAGSVLTVSDGAGGTTTLTPVAGEITITEAQRATLKYTPPPGLLGTMTLYVVATATEGASGHQVDDKTADSVKEKIVLTIVNAVPVVSSPIADRADADAETVSLDTSTSFTDPDGGTLTFSASNLPAGLTINASTGVISGTIDNSASQSGPYTVVVTAKDNNGGTVTDAFTWSVDNPAPTVTSATADQAGADATTVSLSTSTAFTDIDADTLTYSVTGLPAGLSIDASTGLISGTIDNSASQSSPYTIVVEADDGEGGTVTDEFKWVVTNPAPTVTSATADQTSADATVVSLNASTAFTDVDSDTLTYSVSGLPTGLTIDASTGVISGTLDNSASQSGPYTVVVTADDGEGGTVTDEFKWAVTNPAPTVTSATADQTGADASTVSLNASTAFTDVDADTLTYSVTGLPTGLSIDTATGVISGTIDSSASQSGPFTVVVTADDGEGGTVTDEITWTITNPAPTVTSATADQTNSDAATVSLNASTAFADIDADTLTYSVTGLPAGLSIHAATGVISGTIDNSASQSGPYTVVVTADDGEGGTVTDEFIWTITNPAPTVTSATADQTSVEATSVALDTSPAFTDADGDILTYSATGLPAGLTINTTTGVISGTIDNSASISGPYTVVVTADDGEGGTVTDEFIWTITNPAPTVTAAVADQTSSDADSISLNTSTAFNDVDADTLTYSVTGLPAGLSIDAATGVISGTIDNSASQSGPYTVVVTADDGEGGTVTDEFDWVVTNPAPAVTSAIADQSGVDATVVSLNTSTAFTDVDSDTLTYSVSGLPTGLTIDASTGVISGTIDNSASVSGPYTVVVTADDGEGGTVTDEFTWTITNPAPTVTSATANQTSADAATVSLNTAAAFTDVDADTLTYSVTGLPAGLNIDAATGVISGTIDNSASQSGPYTVVVTADDGEGGTVTDEFDWVITNPAPTVTSATADQTNSDAATVSLNASTAFADVDADTLTYSVAGLPAGLSIHAATGVISGTIDNSASQSGPYTVVVTADDGEGGTVTDEFTWTVTNLAPTVTSATADQTSTDASTVSLNASAAFTDVDADTLTYSATGLPTGLSINTSTGVVSGTVDNSASVSGPYTVVVTADDGEGGTVTDEFTWTITNPAPTVTSATANQTSADAATVSLNTAAAFTDVDADTLTYSVTGLPAGLSIDAATGIISGAMDNSASQSGPYTVVVTADDGEGGTVTDEFEWVVTNPAPTVTSATADQTNADAATVSLNASAAFSDIDADTLTYSVTGLPAGLSIDAATGVISGTVDNSASVSGPYTVVVTADDGEGGTVTDEFIWTINNPAPIASADSFITNEDTAVTGNVLSNDSDPDGDDLSANATLVVPPANGGVSMATDGTFTYTPNADFHGTDTFTYEVSDGEGGTATEVATITVLPVNDGPVVTAPIADVTNTDGQTTFLATAGAFSDVDGDTLNYTATNLPTGLSINASTGVISGTINSSASQSGPYSVNVTASDGNGGSATDSFVWTIKNPGPTAVADSLTTSEDVAVTGSVSGNDSDQDGDILTFTQTGPASNGNVSFNASGTFTYTPDADFNGTDSFTYQVSDGEGGTDTATVTITVTSVNDAPVLGTVSTQSAIDGQAIIPLPITSTDVDGDTVSYSATGLPTGLSIDATSGLITGTVDNSASAGAPYSVVVTVTDANGATDTITFDWEVSNPAPTPTGESFSTSEDTAVSGNVLTNDTDPDGDALTVSTTLVAQPANGSVTIAIDGTFTYTPNPNYHGNDSFTYQVSDGEGGVATATVALAVTSVNDGPTIAAAIADQAHLDSQTVSVATASSFTDADGDALTYSVTGLPAGLTIDAATGIISGTIDSSASQSGPYSVTVTAVDENGGTVSDTFDWTVANPAPVVNSAIADQSHSDSQPVVLPTAGALSDPDGDTLTFSASGLPAGLSIDASTGVISGTLAGNASQGGPTSDGNYSITVEVNDGQGGVTTDTFQWSVSNVAPTNGTPLPDVTYNDAESISINAASAFNNLDNDTLTYSATGLPTGLIIDATTGIISGTLDNSQSQLPNALITVTVSDGQGGTATDTFLITVNNPPPVVSSPIPDQTNNDDQAITLNVATSFNDIDSDDLTFVANGLPLGLVIDASTGIISGTIDNSASQSGPYNITITANDGENGLVSDTFTWTINNPAPVVDAAIVDQVGEDSDVISVDVSGAFADADSDTLTYSATGLPAGLAIDPSTGVLTGTIDADASGNGPSNNGTYSVTVTADDGEGGSVSDTFTWTVTNVAPSVVDPLANQTHADQQTISINAASAFIDGDGDPLTYSATGLPDGLSINATTGVIFGTIDNSASTSGSHTVVVTASDGTADITDTFTWNVTNPAPVVTLGTVDQSSADADTVSVAAGAAFNDPDGDTLTYSITGLPAGLAMNTSTGLITGTIDNSASLSSPNTITITADDGEGGTVTDTFVWSISNPAPIAANDSNATSEDTAVSGNVLANDNDPDSDDLTSAPTLVAEPANGTVSLATNGTYTYTPDADFNGTDSFTYSVSDGEGGSDTATVTITVSAVNDAPIVSSALSNQLSDDSETVSVNVTGAFSDVEGDTLTYTSTGLPAGLTLDGTTGIISGTVDHSASVNSPYTVTIEASDGNGGAVTTSFTWGVINPGPEATNDSASTTEDTAVSGNLLDNDSDPDGDTIVALVAPVALPSNGTVSISGDGSYTYTPNANFNGVDTFTYRITDNEGGTSDATVTISVSAENDRPDVVSEISEQSFYEAENVSLNVSGNFTDLDGDTLTYSAAGLPPGLSINTTTGVISGTITSDASLSGPYTTVVTATDSSGSSISDSFNFGVTNPTPVVDSQMPDIAANDSDVISVDSASYFVDVDGDVLTYSATGLPDGLSIDPATGQISGTLSGDASVGGPNGDGSYEIEVTVDDGQGGTATNTFVLQTENIDPSVGALIGPLSSQDGNNITIDVTNNFANPDNDALTFTATGLPAGLSLDPNSGLISGVIDSDASQNGSPYSVEISVDDGQGGTASQTFNWTITNPAPIVSSLLADRTANDAEPVSIDVVNSFVDPDVDTMTFSVSGLPSGTSFDPVTGVISGIIDHSASMASPYTITITADDGQGGSVSQSFVWTINNIQPTAESSTIDSVEDAVVSGTVVPLVGDADGDSLTATIHTAPTNGSVTVNPDGTYTYTPNANYFGTDSFVYQVDDGEGGVETAIITFNISAENDAPVTNGSIADASLLDGQSGVSISTASVFTDADQDVLTYSAANLPEGLSIDPTTGEITGTVDGSASVIGSYPVIITATDGSGATVTATFTIDVENVAPVAGNVNVTTEEDGGVEIAVLDNVQSPDGDIVTVTSASAPNGVVTINPDGTVTYTPNENFNGTDTITYTVSDGEGGTSTATVEVTVEAVNDGPETTGEIGTFDLTDGQSGVNIPLGGAFTDTDGDPLTFTATNLPAGLTIDPSTGVISGTVDGSASQSGPYTVVITVDDGNGGTVTSEFVINVTNVGPVAVSDANATSEDTAVSGNVLANDSDPDGDGVIVATTLTTEPANGSVILDESGLYTYTPDDDFNGTDIFNYTIVDGDGATAEASVTIVVSAVNDPPVLSSAVLSQTGTIGTEVAVDVSGSFTDIDSGALTYAAVGLPPGLTLDPVTGEITGSISPSASTDAPYVVTITASDGQGGSVTTQFTWSVENRGPEGQDQSFTANEDETISGNILDTATDADGDQLVVVTVPVNPPAHGTVHVNLDGSFNYTPDANYNGTDQFTYQVIDNRGGATEVTVSVAITAVNDAPEVISSQDEVAAVEGENVSVSVGEHFVDVDEGSVLTFSASGLPSGLSIDSATGVISGSPELNASGNGPYTVTVFVSDGEGGFNSISFIIDVAPSVQGNFGGDGQGNGNGASGSNYFDADLANGSNAGGDGSGTGSGIILDTVNSIRQLGTTFEIHSTQIISKTVADIEQLQVLLGNASKEFGDKIGHWDVKALAGFSLKSEVLALEGDPNAENIGEIIVEGLQFEETLYLQVTDLLPKNVSADAPRYSITLADGRPLPHWIDFASDGLILIHKPANVENLSLSIKVLLSSNESIEQLITVDVLNAKIALLGNDGGEYQAQSNEALDSMFENQTEEEVSALEDKKLFQALFE